MQQRGIPWQQLPLLRYGFSFGLAIVLSPYLLEIPLYLLVVSWLGFATLSRLRYPWTYRWISGWSIYGLALLTALFAQATSNQLVDKTQLGYFTGYQGAVIQQKTSQRGTSMILQGTWAYDTIQGTWLPFEEKIWISIKDSIPDDRRYQSIILWKKLQAPSRPRSPYEFNFKEYLENNHIHQIAYLEKGEWIGVVKPRNWRDRQVSQLRKLFSEEQYSGLLAALVFGDRRYLPKEIQEQYAQAGAIHVLAVSGLHVGMVLLFLQMIFRVIPGFRGAKGKKYAIPFQMIGIWSYASMTGWSPSVCRASIMLSLLLLARVSRRNTIGVNSLAGAALLLLVYDDGWIYNIGFQFSCLAVL
ncbi:MAG: ComEC/Rec2 family competence protein, partial [Bacteroidota bacterium]